MEEALSLWRKVSSILLNSRLLRVIVLMTRKGFSMAFGANTRALMAQMKLI